MQHMLAGASAHETAVMCGFGDAIRSAGVRAYRMSWPMLEVQAA